MVIRRKPASSGREPICPHCGKKLTELKYNRVRTAWERGTARINEKGWLDSKDEHEDGNGEIEFSCPFCEERICQEEDEAEQFLRTGKIVSEE
jgi:hypothetical protein